MINDWFAAILLGLVEGLTEFIPVSSTGHLLLAKATLKLTDPAWDTFIVMIQLGAILAVAVLYFGRLWKVASSLNQAASRRFVASVALASVPAFVAGLALHDIIKTVLFASPALICWSLIIGGVVLLFIERLAPAPVHDDAMAYPPLTALGVGIFQCLALIPGVSRSGATILGARLLKCDNRSAAEFSFFLAMPIMFGAFVLDAWDNRNAIDLTQAELIGVGFAVSFLSGLVVVRTMLGFVARRGLAPFAWWRIVVGVGGLALLRFG